jgi:hypothetical protein
MRGFGIYLAAGILVVLAMDFIAPPAGLDLNVAAGPVLERGSTIQFVDRTHKSDRLAPPPAVSKPPAPPAQLVGCDPVYSPLSAAARADISRHCVA